MLLPDDLALYHATTLTERLAAGILPDILQPIAEDDLARYRRQSWETQFPFVEESYFAQRLAFDHLTESQWRGILTEPLESLQKRFAHPPAWLSDLVTALSQPNETDLTSLLSDSIQSNPISGFLKLTTPFLTPALARFDAGVARVTTGNAPFDPTTIKKILFAHLPEQLLSMLSRTMALELNVARLSGQLTGATPEVRFQSFLAHLDQPEWQQAFWQEYPVLARLILEQTQAWANVSLEFLTRLCADWEDIKKTFNINDPGVLVAVKGGIADTHRGGQSVFLAKFSSGFRLVYKPKSLRVDVHFQQFLQWLNVRGAAPSFPTLTVLARESYGWVEYVKAHECKSQQEVQRFYRRQGGYLALLYVLDATDFHAGNLIAAGEFPFLIDLEALFHPHRSSVSETVSASRLARRTLSHSVLRTGLLPERSWGNSENEGVDTSGLGTIDNQLTPHALPHSEEAGTDTMHLTRKRKRIKADKNRPRLPGGGVNVLDYRDEVLAGFAYTYELLRANRDELLSENGPLTWFAADEVCVFLRSMRTYRRLLRESFHPDVLRDALDRDRHFDLLWAEIKDDPELAQLICAERNDLWRGDIPMFTTRPASRDLWINANERIADFFAEPSLSIVQRRVQQLSPADGERQMWFIQASMATLPMQETPSATTSTSAPVAEVSQEQLHAAARAIGDRLEALALRGADEASWLGLMREPGRAWFIESLGFDLDAGLPGVALFLAHLGTRTREPRYTALAQAALTTMQQQIAEWGDEVTRLGAFDGWGGVIYTLTQLGVLWQRPDLLAAAETIAVRVPEWIVEDDVFDVFGGAAGCIGALHCLAQETASEHVTAAAIQCGDHLLAHNSAVQTKGFAHGTTGLAWALFRLHGWTGLERFRAAAMKTLPQTLNGLDDATDDQIGVMLAALPVLRHADTPTRRAKLAAALDRILSRAFASNHSLSHGAAGGLELLLQSSQTLGEPQWKNQLRRQTAALLASIAQDGWRCGTPLAVETPGLLTGLAGIGYELLRVAEPEFVPAVLTLEPLAIAPPPRCRKESP